MLIDYIAAHPGFPHMANPLSSNAFSNQLDPNGVVYLMVLLNSEMPGSFDYSFNGSTHYAMANAKTIGLSQTQGVIKHQEAQAEEIERQIMKDANQYFNTELAKRNFENYDRDQERLSKAETRASNAELP